VAGSRDRYLRFLGSGGSDYPLELLRRAGVALEDAAQFRDTFSAVSSHLDEIEMLLDDSSSGAGPR
jgi:oligoendopeptidase F